MQTETREWRAGLITLADEQRSRGPRSVCAPADPQQIAERSIIAADLAARLAAIDELLAARTAPSATTTAADADPVVVVTTTAPGIAATADLLGGPLRHLERSVVAVTELEYRLWCIRRPDEACRWHINLWSWVKTRVPDERWTEFAAHPLADGERYWLHRTGVAGAGAADHRSCSLWKWNGRHAALLAARVRERAVSHLGSPARSPTAD